MVVSCLASRTGGLTDSWTIDYGASKNCLDALRENDGTHYVLLSAICVQKPLLEFQKAKVGWRLCEADYRTACASCLP